MSSEKTEQPTPKKLRDAAKKGQTFKTRDLIVGLMLFCATAYLVKVTTFDGVAEIYKRIIAQNFDLSIHDLVVMLGLVFLKQVIPVFVLCTVVSAVPALLLSKFSLATEALKIDFAKLNPVEGVKKLFSLRTVKDLVKALLYLLMFAVAFWVLWANNKTIIFAQLHGQVTSLASVMASLFMSFMAISMLCCLPVFVLDSLAEFYLHIKNLKMDKHEVKREYKEQEGNPEFKQHRREVHMELLSEQVKSDVKQSNFILANPTHIALGVYFRPELCPAPMISLIETDARARAVIAYAEKCGVPVVRDIPLARSLYKAVSRYSLVPFEYFHGILSILEWLHNVETFAHLEETTPDSSETETPQP